MNDSFDCVCHNTNIKLLCHCVTLFIYSKLNDDSPDRFDVKNRFHLPLWSFDQQMSARQKLSASISSSPAFFQNWMTLRHLNLGRSVWDSSNRNVRVIILREAIIHLFIFLSITTDREQVCWILNGETAGQNFQLAFNTVWNRRLPTPFNETGKLKKVAMKLELHSTVECIYNIFDITFFAVNIQTIYWWAYYS